MPGRAAGVDVLTDDGPLRGSLESGLAVFKGIPYAAPPVGSLRWAPPVRPSPWTTPRLATQFGPACPQNRDLAPQDENCLFLNVWAHTEGTARAVLVWIHGGGFIEGAASEGWYDGAELARRENLIVVSVNYRLGVLGFLALPQLTAPDTGTGNWGLRDQIAALQWVRRNIAAFGGDPSRVMIAGESAGGASVAALLAAAPAQGLFHRAAVQSGTYRPVMAQEAAVGAFPSAYSVGLVTAVSLGCTHGDIATCLRSKTPAQVLGVQSRFSPVNELGFGLMPTLPVVDGVVLTGRPLARIHTGAGDVPVLMGSTGDELSFVMASLGVVGHPGDFGRYVDFMGASAKKEQLTALYQPALVGEVAAATALGTDVSFACPSLKLATARAARGSSPVYLYQFARAVPDGVLAPLGAVHGTDIVYLFGHFGQVGATPTALDLELSSRVQHAWGALARTGVPAPPAAWPSFTPGGPFLSWNIPDSREMNWRAGRCASLEALGLLPE
ncbi:carboxylesterase/lipase family protein [Stigmatella erecta]|uniref:Carboxylic ester hydrolase n=1 Tax=Stigmatella erecta TaxID=83460 RepID=A0A1I0L4H9_9BACT|nr:carboxylesterase family protein [Stigmatella erecta]SEU34411.1 para-nitrobenzyl esterase [Stigmatella erecta]